MKNNYKKRQYTGVKATNSWKESPNKWRITIKKKDNKQEFKLQILEMNHKTREENNYTISPWFLV